MRCIPLILAVAALAVLSACDDTRPILTPIPAGTPVPVNPDPCGDGTVLQPNQHCP